MNVKHLLVSNIVKRFRVRFFNRILLLTGIILLFITGPPESMRDQVIAAAHAMRTGDWKLCSEYILGIKVCSGKIFCTSFYEEF